MMSKYAVTNPATGEVENEFPDATDDQIRQAVDRASAAFDQWSTTDPAHRSSLLNRVADLYQERTEDLARIITREMGKPHSQACLLYTSPSPRD